ncbi:MAG: glycosyltransferase family 39 protein [Candidatus Hydrogenedentota bacterium]
MIKYKYKLVFILILIVSIFHRFYRLNDIPPGLYHDVAINGNDAINALCTHNFRIIYPNNNNREGLFINLIAISFWVFGSSVLSIKLVPAAIGVLTVAGLYLLAKELFYSEKNIEEREALSLLCTFFIAISFWHVNFSRIGFRGIMVPFIMVFSFYFLLLAVRTNKVLHFIFAGLFFGLGFYTYTAFQVAPLILVVKFICEWMTVKKNRIKSRRLKWSIMCLTIIIILIPIIIYISHHPKDLFMRASDVSIFASQSPLNALITSSIKTFAQFNYRGDYNWRHNYSGDPQLNFIIGIFFLIGLTISIVKTFRNETGIHNNNYLFLLVWFIVMLLPSILTIEGVPHSLRSIGAIPVAMIFAGIGANWIYKKVQNNFLRFEKQILIISCLLLIFISYSEYRKYFSDWANNDNTRLSFNEYCAKVGYFLNSVPEDISKYVLVNVGGLLVNGIPMPSQTIQFLTYGKSKVGYISDPIALNRLIEKIKLTKVPENKVNSIIIVPLNPEEQYFNYLIKLLPEGKIQVSNEIKYFVMLQNV